ncbi:MAG: DUF4230 domain-containing protein [Candidatus Sulfotelmatobacter sp.]
MQSQTVNTRLDTAQYAHQSAADAVFRQNAAGDLLLVNLAGVQILHRSSQGFGLRQRGLFQPPAHLFNMRPKILQQDLPTDPNLETQVRQEAERQLQEAALADGILRTAQQNGASTISSLLQGLGFEKIDFD